MGRAYKLYERGFTCAPYITADLLAVKNEKQNFQTFEFNPVKRPGIFPFDRTGQIDHCKNCRSS